MEKKIELVEIMDRYTRWIESYQDRIDKIKSDLKNKDYGDLMSINHILEIEKLKAKKEVYEGVLIDISRIIKAV